MIGNPGRILILISCACAIFWPGAFIFGFPGVMSRYWQQAFNVGGSEVGQTVFFVLMGATCFMYLCGRWQEKYGPRKMAAIGAILCGSSVIWLGRAETMNAVYVWEILAAVVGFAFGTLFAVTAPLAGDCFGMAHFGAIFGLIFTAYGFLSGPLGPWLSGYILDHTQDNYTLVFSYLGIMYLASAGLILRVQTSS